MQNHRSDSDRIIGLKMVENLVAAEIVPQLEADLSFRGYFADLFQSDKELLEAIVAAIGIQNKFAFVLQSNFAPGEIAFYKTFINFRERELDVRRQRYGAFAPYAVPFLLIAAMFLLKITGVPAMISVPLVSVFFLVTFTLYFYGMYLLHKAKYINAELKCICEAALEENRKAD